MMKKSPLEICEPDIVAFHQRVDIRLTEISCPKCNAECDLLANAAEFPAAMINCAECRHCFEAAESVKPSPPVPLVLKPQAVPRQVRRIVVRPDPLPEKTSRNDGIKHSGQMSGPGRPDTEPGEGGAQSAPAGIGNLRNIAAAIGVVVVIGGAILLRDQVVSVIPAMAGLYKLAGITVNSTQLQFAAVTTSTEQGNDGNVLVVEGMIRNLSLEPVAVPAVRLRMRTADKENISGWTLEPEQTSLEAGKAMKFTTRLNGAPENVRDIVLEFVDRPKQAGVF